MFVVIAVSVDRPASFHAPMERLKKAQIVGWPHPLSEAKLNFFRLIRSIHQMHNGELG
jgi:hypothetical protein